MDIITAIKTAGAIYEIAGKTKNVMSGLRETPDLQGLYNFNGNMINLLGEFIVEPLVVISEDAMQNGSVTEKMTTVMLDTFTGYYLQSFNILNTVYGMDAKAIVTVLATDNGFNKLKASAYSKAMDLGREGLELAGSSLTRLSGMSHSLNDLLELTTESGIGNLPSGKGSASLTPTKDGSNGILGNGLLTRHIEVKLSSKSSTGEKIDICIPITIKARLIKVTTQNILEVSNPNRKNGSLTTWLDYKAGLASFWDFVFQNKAVEAYKQKRIKGNEFLEIMNSRKLSATSKLITDNKMGYELNYNLIIITENDRAKIEKECALNIFKEREKDMFLNSVYALSAAVMDETYEQVTLLTPNIRGLSTVSYKEVKGLNNKSNNDMTDFVKALMTNRNLF